MLLVHRLQFSLDIVFRWDFFWGGGVADGLMLGWNIFFLFCTLVYYKNFDFVSVFFLISLFCYRIFSSADVTDHFFPSKYYLQLYTCTKECSEQFVKQNIHAIFFIFGKNMTFIH